MFCGGMRSTPSWYFEDRGGIVPSGPLLNRDIQFIPSVQVRQFRRFPSSPCKRCGMNSFSFPFFFFPHSFVFQADCPKVQPIYLYLKMTATNPLRHGTFPMPSPRVPVKGRNVFYRCVRFLRQLPRPPSSCKALTSAIPKPTPIPSTIPNHLVLTTPFDLQYE